MMLRRKLLLAAGTVMISALPVVHLAAEPGDSQAFQENAISPIPNIEPDVGPGISEVLAERERALAAREAELEEAKKDLERARVELEAKLQRLEQLVDQAKAQERAPDRKAQLEARRRKMERLIRTIEKMDPQAAAAYLSKFPIGTASAVLHGMNLRKAAKIIENLPASKAADVSRYYLKNGQPPPSTDSNRDGKRR